MSLGQLALHVATVPGDVAELAAIDTIPEPPAFVQPEAGTASELVPSLAKSVARGETALGTPPPLPPSPSPIRTLGLGATADRHWV